MERIIWHTFSALTTTVFMVGFMSTGEIIKNPGRYPALALWAAVAATIIGAMGLLQYGHWYRTGSSTPIFRIPRFSLRTLFVVVTVAAFLSLIAPPMIRWLFPPKPEIEQIRSIIFVAGEKLAPEQDDAGLKSESQDSPATP
jgi:hypothetical protein